MNKKKLKVIDQHETCANNEQVGGNHYKDLGIQVWDIVIANKLDFFQGGILKYVMRSKGGRDKKIEDLKKAKHYIDKYIELLNDEPEKVCPYPECSCPFDMGADNKCAKGYKHETK